MIFMHGFDRHKNSKWRTLVYIYIYIYLDDQSIWLIFWTKSFSLKTDYNFMINVYSLIPFYFMYCAFVPLHAKFYVTIYRIGLRYRKLNRIIKNYGAFGEICYGSFIWKFHRKLIIVQYLGYIWFRHQRTWRSFIFINKMASEFSSVILWEKKHFSNRNPSEKALRFIEKFRTIQ